MVKENIKPQSQLDPTGISNPFLNKKQLTEQLGADGTRNFYGYVYQDKNPNFSDNRVNSVLYDKMRKNDAQIHAILQAIFMPILSTNWWVKPATDKDGNTSDLHKEIAEFVYENYFERMDFFAFLSDALGCVTFGYSVFEKVYCLDGERIMLDRLAFRRPETILKWTTLDNAPGITQTLDTPILTGPNAGKNQVSIPAEKLLIFTYQKEGNDPQGTSVLRTAFKHWNYVDNFYKFDAVRQERESLGVPIIYKPHNTSPATNTKLSEIVGQLRTSEQLGVTMPGSKDEGFLLEFANPGAGDRSNIWESIKYHNLQITKNILATFIETGTTGTGSYALSENQSSVFMYSLESIAKLIRGVLNKFSVKELVDLNYETDGYYPTIEYDKLGEVELDKIANALATLANAGLISGDDNTENYLRDIYRLPPKEKLLDKEQIDEEEQDEEISDPEKPDNSDDPETPGKPEDPKKPEMPVEKEPTLDDEEMEEKINKPNDDKVEAKENTPGKFDESWLQMSKLFNNRTILELQNELSPEEMDELKKKGVRFNDFEEKAWRPLTFAERKVNFSLLAKNIKKYTTDLDKSLGAIEKRQKIDLLNQVKKAVNDNDLKALGTIKIKFKGEAAQAITNIQKEVFETGKKSASVEMGVRVPPTKREVQGAMRVQTDAVVDKAMNDAENAAKTAVAQHANQRGGISQLGPTMATSVASAAIEDALAKAHAAYSTYAIGGAMNTGRASVFERYPEKVKALQYSAIIDDRTTEFCLSLDGRVFEPGSVAASQYMPPNHYNCRSIMVEILEDEAVQPEIDTPKVLKSIQPVKDISSAGQMTKPYVKANSPAIAQIQREIDRRQTLVDKYRDAGTYESRVARHETRIKTLQSAIKGKFVEWAREQLKSK